MNLRPYRNTVEDNRAITRLENLIWPDQPITEEAQQHRRDSCPPDAWMEEWCIELDDHVVAYGYVIEGFWSTQSRLFEIGLTTEPAYQRQGIGRRLYDHCLKHLLMAHEVDYLTTTTREDKPDAIRFLENRGFALKMREPESELKVSSFDFTPFAAKEQQVEAHGITIQSLASLASCDPDWQAKKWHLNTAIMRDVPRQDPYNPPTREQFIQQHMEGPDFDAATMWIALHGGQWVGGTELWINPASRDKVYTGITGVTRNYRRRGIATTLKLQAIRYARDHGFTTIITDNEENNPMFQINLALGFRALPAWLSFRKDCRRPESSCPRIQS